MIAPLVCTISEWKPGKSALMTEGGLLARQVGGEVCREVGGIEKDEAVRCLDQRFGGVGELLTVGGLGLPSSGACAAM
jgi:hypothetical protein